MRLTNVSQINVQPGRPLTYSVTAGAAEPAIRLPLSFDQDRHVILGSWMPVAFFHLPVQAKREIIAQAWLRVISRHGTLRTVFTEKQDDVAPPSQQRDGTDTTATSTVAGRS